MIKKGFKKAVRLIGLHGSVLLKGLVRMAVSVGVAKLVHAAALGFTVIPEAEGYDAVCSFILSTFVMLAALSGVYLMGGHPKKEVKK